MKQKEKVKNNQVGGALEVKGAQHHKKNSPLNTTTKPARNSVEEVLM